MIRNSKRGARPQKKAVKAPADLSEIRTEMARIESRINGIRLLADDAGTSAPYGCGSEERSGANTLTVMYGLRDGTSCRVSNINYYKQLRLEVPE